MAVGDAVSVLMGTANVTRQPASGVEEQISAIVKVGTTDKLALDDGSGTHDILDATIATDLVQTAGSFAAGGTFNTALMITNSLL